MTRSLRALRNRAAAVALSGAMLAGAVACRSGEARRLEAEVMALDRKIDALRTAPNEAKAPLLAEVERAPCEQPAVCELKALCVRAYRSHLQAIAASERAKRLLSEPDGGTLASIRAAQEVARADFELASARESSERCATKQGELRRQARAR